MNFSRNLLTLVLALPLASVACTSPPGDGIGSGGSVNTSGGGSPAAGGALGTGGNAASDASAGGTGTGSTGVGGASTGDGDGGLAGSTASGGSENSGGVSADGGTSLASYGPCDTDLASENNPECAAGEICFENTCTETCPTGEAAAEYDCPEPSTGTAPSVCHFLLGRCQLACQGQNGEEYSCPVDMVCDGVTCSWP